MSFYNTIIIYPGNYLKATPNSYSAWEGLDATININEVILNDIDQTSGELSIVDIVDPFGGSVDWAVSSGTVTFTPTLSVGQTGHFYYILESSTYKERVRGKVNVSVIDVPEIETSSIIFDTWHDGKSTIYQSQIIDYVNDPSGYTPLNIISVSNPIGGTVTKTGTKIEFDCTAAINSNASFDYIVENSIGLQGTGTVNFNVKQAVFANGSSIELFAGYSNIVSYMEITKNDVDLSNNYPLTLVSVNSISGGLPSLNGTDVVFESVGVDDPSYPNGSFSYTIENTIGIQATGIANISLVPLPSPAPVRDEFSVMQGNDIIISKQSLADNDYAAEEYKPLVVTSVHDPYGGTFTEVGDTITFTPTVVAYNPCGFKYTVENNIGGSSVGNVYVEVTPLPEIEAYIYDDMSGVQQKIDSGYVPPTFETIFNTWPRYCTGSCTLTDPYNPTDPEQWIYESENDNVRYLRHSHPQDNGILSLDVFDNYIHEARITANDDDPGSWDSAGLVIAAFRDPNDGNRIHKLTAIRSAGHSVANCHAGQNPIAWCVIYNQGLPDEKVIIKDPGPWIIDPYIGTGGYNDGSNYNWRLNPLGVMIRVEREGDIIRCYSTQKNSEIYIPEAKIEINLNDYPELVKFKGKQHYGYTVFSNPGITWTDVKFKGGIDTERIVDVLNENIWAYDWAQGWIIDDTISIQEAYGYVRETVNPDTGERYLITETEIIKIT